MPTPEQWREMIAGCTRDYIVTAHSYRGIQLGNSFSSPVVLGCSDGEDYVVKSPKNQQLLRAICNDQVMGHVAAYMLAPVPTVKIVEIPQTLVQNQRELAGIPAGPAHGSRYIPNASKTKHGIAYQNVPGNRERFAILAFMYGVAGVFSDHQFFYEDGSNLVWSFDHGHFFPKGPDWTIATLAAAPDAVPDPTIVAGCNLTSNELADVKPRLVSVTPVSISMAVASPVDSWGLSPDDRVALADHLHKRRETLCA